MPEPPHDNSYNKAASAKQTLALTPEQIEIMAKRKLKGETFQKLAREFSTTPNTATKHIKRWIAKQTTSHSAEPLPRLIGAEVNRPRAFASSSEKFDPLKTQLVNNPIQSDGKEQSYRENLLWACQAAGQKLRTGNRPTSCPNDKAFFLYQLACENPKDFMTKFSQVETKEKDDAEDKAKKRSTQFLLEEIESQLEALEVE